MDRKEATMANTPIQETSYTISNHLIGVYPTTESITSYVNLNTIVTTEPTNGDKLLIAIIQQFAEMADSARYGANIVMTSTQKKAFYTELNNRLVAMQTALNAVQSAVSTYLGTLP